MLLPHRGLCQQKEKNKKNEKRKTRITFRGYWICRCFFCTCLVCHTFHLFHLYWLTENLMWKKLVGTHPENGASKKCSLCRHIANMTLFIFFESMHGVSEAREKKIQRRRKREEHGMKCQQHSRNEEGEFVVHHFINVLSMHTSTYLQYIFFCIDRKMILSSWQRRYGEKLWKKSHLSLSQRYYWSKAEERRRQ